MPNTPSGGREHDGFTTVVTIVDQNNMSTSVCVMLDSFLWPKNYDFRCPSRTCSVLSIFSKISILSLPKKSVRRGSKLKTLSSSACCRLLD